MSSPDSNVNNSPDASDRSRAGLDPLEAMTTCALILQVLTTLVDSVNSQRGASETRDAQIEARLSSLETATEGMTRLLRNALARPADPASAAEPVSRQVLRMEQAMLWSWETAREGLSSLRLPRPSIIGRALFDLQQAEVDTYEGSVPAKIYITISENGRHHLSETASNRVARYLAGETRAMSGKINEHLEPRFEALSDRSKGRYYAEIAGERRSLTARGSQVFANWPDWSARDEDVSGDGRGISGSAPPVGGTTPT